jgi:hypothetical protein
LAEVQGHVGVECRDADVVAEGFDIAIRVGVYATAR